jgi:hypothetical protein
MQTYTNLNNQECVIVQNEDGSIWSGLKSAYDEMIAKKNEAATL